MQAVQGVADVVLPRCTPPVPPGGSIGAPRSDERLRLCRNETANRVTLTWTYDSAGAGSGEKGPTQTTQQPLVMMETRIPQPAVSHC